MMAALRSPGLVTTLVLLLRLLSASAAPRLVGMYDADSPGHSRGGSDPALKGWTNLAMSTAANAAAASHHGGPKNQLLNLQDVLFDTNTTGNRTIELLPDWQQRWKELLPLAKALFANHSATGFFFGDELVGGGGLPWHRWFSPLTESRRTFQWRNTQRLSCSRMRPRISFYGSQTMGTGVQTAGLISPNGRSR